MHRAAHRPGHALPLDRRARVEQHAALEPRNGRAGDSDRFEHWLCALVRGVGLGVGRLDHRVRREQGEGARSFHIAARRRRPVDLR